MFCTATTTSIRTSVTPRPRGAEIVYEPVDQAYGYREYSAWDSEGGLRSFMKPQDQR